MTWQPIVAGVDGSPESFRAASLAWRIARAADARCVLVYAVPDVWVPGGMAPLANSPHVFDQLVSDLRQQLARDVGAEVPAAVRNALISRPWRPGVVQDEIVREHGASLVFDVGSVWDRATERKVRLSTGFGFHTDYSFITLGIPLNAEGSGVTFMAGVRF